MSPLAHLGNAPIPISRQVSVVIGVPNQNYIFGVRKDQFSKEIGVLLSGEEGRWRGADHSG